MKQIEIISAPSILGLKPTGVEALAESLLAAGLAEKLGITSLLFMFLRSMRFIVEKGTRRRAASMQYVSEIFHSY